MCIPPYPLARMSLGLPWPLFLSVLLIGSFRPAASAWCKDDPPVSSSNTCAELKDLGKCDAKVYPSMAGKCCRTCFDCEPGCETYNVGGVRYLPPGAVESVDPYNVPITDARGVDKVGRSGVSNTLARVPCVFSVFTACSHPPPPPHTH